MTDKSRRNLYISDPLWEGSKKLLPLFGVTCRSRLYEELVKAEMERQDDR